MPMNPLVRTTLAPEPCSGGGEPLSFPALRWLGALGLALSLATAAASAQLVELEYHLPAGTSYTIRSAESMRMEAQMQDGFGNRQSMTQSFESPTNYRVEVLEADGSGDAGPGKVRYTFEPGLMVTMNNSQMGQQQLPLPFAGKTFEVERRNGQITVSTPEGPAQNLAPETQRMLETLATFNESTLLPPRPVSVGETWKPDMSSVMQGSGMAPGGSLVMTARLAGMEHVVGRPAAIVDLELAWDATMQGMSMKGPQRGRAAIDLATGLLLEFDLQGQLQVANDPNMNMGGAMSGTSRLASTRRVSNVVTPLAVAQAAAPAAEAWSEQPAEETSAGEGPAGEGPGPVAGSEQAGVTLNLSAPPFEGTYVGDELTVTLIEGERRGVEIVRGDITTRGVLTGNREINQSIGSGGKAETTIEFQGEFTFNDATFGFSAVQPDATTMLFTTGKTTHTLQRKAEPSAPNPFE